MCGIDGFFSTNAEFEIGTRYYYAHKLLGHRGPDDEGFVVQTGGKIQYCYGDNSVDGVFSCDTEMKHLEEYKLPLVTYISHPKNLISVSLCFLSSVEWKNYMFITLDELL